MRYTKAVIERLEAMQTLVFEIVERNLDRCNASVPYDLRKVVEGYYYVIGTTMRRECGHDAGAHAQCSHCARYTTNPFAGAYAKEMGYRLWCDCGQHDGWTGSFARPTPESRWSITSRRERVEEASAP